MNTFHILITVVVTSVLWLIYIKFFYQRNNLSEKEALRIKDDQIKEKDHEIEKIKMSHENEIKLLSEKFTSVENIKNSLQETLTNERESSKVTLSTLKNVEAWKTTVTSDMQDNSNLIKKQQSFIDKLTNNQKYQGNFG